MPLVDGFKDSTRLTDAYIACAGALSKVEEHLRRNDLSAARHQLFTSADILCRTFQQLLDDPFFWQDVQRLEDLVSGRQAPIRSGLQDIELFIEQETQIFELAGLTADIHTKLLTDLILALRAVEEEPTTEALNRLRENIEEASKRVCAVRDRLRPQGKISFVNGLIKTREGMAVLGGLTTIVINAIASVDLHATLSQELSVVAGAASAASWVNWLRK